MVDSEQDSINKRRKGFKHSKKFARSQRGCLQCRQKKKKCDMARPGCVSCEKRGIKCEFPENIKIFQIESFQPYQPEVGKTPRMRMHEIKFEKEEEKEKKIPEATSTDNFINISNHTPLQDQQLQRSRSVSVLETKKSLAEKITQSLLQQAPHITSSSHPPTPTLTSSAPTAAGSPSSSSATLPVTATGTPHNNTHTHTHTPASPLSEHLPLHELPLQLPAQEYHSPSRATQEAQPQHVHELFSILKENTNNTDRAISMAMEGQSIRSILDGFAVDLIKRSIESLNFVNLERQQMMADKQQREMKDWAIKEALKFDPSQIQLSQEEVANVDHHVTQLFKQHESQQHQAHQSHHQHQQQGQHDAHHSLNTQRDGGLHESLVDWEAEIFKVGWQGGV